VYVLTGESGLSERLSREGVVVHFLGIDRTFAAWRGGWRLRADLAQWRPDVVQTWMYHADFLGGIVAASLGIPVVWGVRNSSLSRSSSKRSTRALVRCLAVMSRLVPHLIVMNAESSKVLHAQLGYRADRIVVIPNGIDINHFRRCDALRRENRALLGIDPDRPLVGMMARYDPQKDHENFLIAASIVSRDLPQVRFLLCGRGCGPDNRVLAERIGTLGLDGRVMLLGERADIVELMNALDLNVLTSSYGEAFPNVLGEALACEVPAVATDIGDSAIILGNPRWIVPPGVPQAAANAWLDSLRLETTHRERMRKENRERVVREYNLEIMVDRFHTVYRNLTRPV
jgi:glycosyltransferase involved in cell wall biosynthesis